MQIEDAQREMRQSYLGAAPGQFVSGMVWLISAAFGTWGSRNAGATVLVLGGALIFPLTMLLLRVLGRPARVSRDNPLNALAIQVAFTVPLAIPLVLAAAGAHAGWFYPGFMIVVGAHYLPFVTLYGLRHFVVAAAVLVTGGVLLPGIAPGQFALGGWIGGAVLLAMSAWLLATHRASETSR